MDDAATTIYCLCEEFLEAIDRWVTLEPGSPPLG